MALRLRLDKPWRPLTAEVVDRLPGQLGVYQIADAKGTIVYIGQAGARTAFGLRSELQREASQRASGHQFRVEVNQHRRIGTGNRQTPQLSSLDVSQHCGRAADLHLGFVAECSDSCRTRAFVWHVHDVDASH